MKTIIIVVVVLIAVGILIWVFAKGSYKNNNPTTNNSSQVSAPNTVNIANFSFQPSSLEVAKGTKVTWTNNDSTAHTITSDTGVFSSDKIEPGKTFEFTFNEAGTFAYHCSIHTTMKANITVK